MSLRWRIAQFFEIRWWRRYLHKKDISVYLDWKRDYWRRFMQECFLYVPADARVLDAGCGPAGIYMIFDRMRVDAVDPLLGNYQKNIPHFRPDYYPWVQFTEQKIEDYLSDYQYDAVFCLNAINHVEDIGTGLDKLADLTRSGGQIILSIDAHRHPFLKTIFRLFPGDILHPHQYDLSEYRQMLEERGVALKKQVLLKPGAIFNYYVLIGELKR